MVVGHSQLLAIVNKLTFMENVPFTPQRGTPSLDDHQTIIHHKNGDFDDFDVFCRKCFFLPCGQTSKQANRQFPLKTLLYEKEINPKRVSFIDFVRLFMLIFYMGSCMVRKGNTFLSIIFSLQQSFDNSYIIPILKNFWIIV